ncbi:MAG: PilN domain-containing protein [Nitrospirota bacterium]|nr:PilN domain-containing protein [Nitrospirota bacterium]
MIRINLLPTKKSKKAVVVEKQLIYIVAGCIAVAVILGYIWVSLNGRISNLQDEKTRAQQMAADLKKKIKEVENYEKDKKALEEKIAIIEGLRKMQELPVHMLDEISKALPAGVWLSDLKEANAQVSLSGTAFSNDDIVAFVNNLRSSAYVADVTLLESVMTGTTQKVYSFKMTVKLKS